MRIYAIRGLTKVYDRRSVLNIPALDIAPGEIYGLLGPNGAGKSTLLNILAFIDRPSSGEIFFRSAAVDFSAALQALRREVVLVDQHPILFTNSVAKNVEFGLRIRRVPGPKRRVMVEEALDLVGMRSFAPARADRLSGGETQRVAIARALALSPSVLLCDEPTASVDLENQAIILNILRRINAERRITILFTTHDRFQAASLASRTLFLNSGKLGVAPLENVFSVEMLQKTDGSLQGVVQDHLRLSLPAGFNGARTGKVRVFVDPERIELVALPDGPVSGPESVGRVVQLSEERDRVRVVVDAGTWVTVLLAPDAYHLRKPMVGEAVGLRMAPGSVRVINEDP